MSAHPDANPAGAGGPAAAVHRILYVCATRKPFSREELSALLAKSRINNERDGITGLLLYKNGLFTQLLEGPADAVRRCFERISRDPRHDGCTVLDEDDAGERTFPDWRMGYRNLSDPAVTGMPGFSDFMNPGATGGNTAPGTSKHYWQLLDFFRREM